MTLFSIAFALFLLMDPVGNVPIFLSILREIEPKNQRRIVFREHIFALVLIIAFYFLGDILLDFLGISQPAVLISGGVILFIIAIKMIFPKPNEASPWSGYKEPFLVPLAMPLIAGPAVLAAIMLYSHRGVDHWIALGGIFIAWLSSAIILIAAIPLKKVLGEKGISALEKLMGLLLVMLGVQMLLNGIKGCLAAA